MVRGICAFLLVCCLCKNGVSGLYNAKTFSLPNGLVFYIIPNHRVPVVTQIVVYKVGSADDPLGKSGLAHFLEHMMFKGPKGSTAADLMKKVGKVGGAINAVTSYDMTYYYESVPKGYLDSVMAAEADRMRAITVLDEQLNTEKQVVLDEQNMRIGNNPVSQFYSHLLSVFYRHHPYGTVPIGWRHEINTYNKQDVLDFHKRWYAPNNAFIILSGDINLFEARKLAEKYYADIPLVNDISRNRVSEPKLTYKINIAQRSDQISTPLVALVLNAPAYQKSKPNVSLALSCVCSILTNKANGILRRRLVEDLKIATDVNVYYNPNALDGAFIAILAEASAGVSEHKLADVLKTEIAMIVKNGIDKEIFANVKLQMLSGIDYLQDSLTYGAIPLIEPLVKGIALEDIENEPEYIKKLNISDINNSFKQYFSLHQGVVEGYLLPDKS